MKLYNFPFKTMGCSCNIKFYCDSEKDADYIFKLCFQEADRLDKYYSNYSSTSFTSEINRSSGNTNGIEIDEETAALLKYANQCYEQSDGLFDITSGILYKIWNFDDNNQKNISKVPSPAIINELLKRVGWHKIILKENKVILPISGMLLDFGGIVKEYAADKLAQICLAQGIHHGIINLSGDMRILGPHPDNTPWEIQIKAPRDNIKNINILKISQGALATSGDYERCFFIKNKRYCHILNPKTGWPVFGLSSVTVITDLCIVAGTVTTTALLKGKNKGLSWLKSLNIPFLCYDNNGKQTGLQLK